MEAAPRRAATLHDVAREAGVSYATASRALNGSDRNVRAENVARVHIAAEKLGYAPHLSAQAIARGSTSTVALVVSDVDDPYFSSIAAGVTEAAEAEGLIVTMAVADRSPDLELRIVRTLRGQRPRAIVIAGSRIDGTDTGASLLDELEAYRTAGGRVAIVSQPGLPFPTLAIDNAGGARRLARALVGLGYRHFGVVHAPDTIRTSHDRRTGFLAGLAESGLGAHLVEVDFTREGGYAAAGVLADRGALPGRGAGALEVVFAVNDVMAIGVMTGLRDAGLTPGRDLAVAGFDDIGAAVDVTPPLTSVAVPLHELGRRALRAALDGTPPGVLPIPAEVVLRGSTPPRG
ncbi:LacI family transcriptional regulator [Actinoplanes sp. ATCC 53533]|uniref:LacI family DNA-binding transcriptional regulator n=1 Tax=Actinoplanes sp. ATCC 53533 TaxID=1288362 RepID=UPI000F79EAA8|nr:LacI family DNA-binding transcriptional regulator [Actinoplanes sp. ATCC 53533]RSM59847.1 LacI family transcriptional regulator [Actinoplanes sp. ATCC 53533]